MNARKKRYQAIQEHRSTHKELEQDLLSEDKKKYDPNATTEDCLSDLRRVQEEHPTTHITRQAYRKLGKYSDSTWDSRFGTFHEFRRQAGLELSRGQTKLERDIAKHSSLDVYRGFAEVEVLPWVGKYERTDTKKWQSGIIASDFHDKEVDPFVMGVLLETIKRVQPTIVCLAGDVYDNYEFSRFATDPRQHDTAGRMRFVRDNILRPIREAAPSAQIDLLMGNHEHHLLRHMADRTPEMRTILSDFMGLSLSDIMGLSEFEINLVTKHDLAAFRSADIRSEIAKNRKTYFNCLTASHYPDPKFTLGTNWVSGHTHKPGMHSSSSELLGPLLGVVNGGMCKVDASYVEKNRDQNGFTIVEFNVENSRCQLTPIVFADEFVNVAGIRYTRPSNL